MKRVLVLGGGFAGMWAALTAARELALAGSDAQVTLVSQDDALTVRPRLYECFTPAFRAPLRPVLDPLGISLHLGSAKAIDTAARSVDVIAANGNHATPGYDRLVIATGSVQRPLPVAGADSHAFDIDTYASAERLDRHLAAVLSSAEEPGRLTFVIVGAGFTGIELAAEMRIRLRVHTDAATAERARIVLIERQSTLGPELGANPRPHVQAALDQARVEVRLGVSLREITARRVVLEDGETLETMTVVVTAGLVASPLAGALSAPRDMSGRLRVDAQLRVTGCRDVFAAGDVAHAQADATHAALMSCQHAVPMGKFAGYNVAHDLLGTPLRDYRQPDYVTCLDLGEAGAIFTQGWERVPVQVGPEVKALKQKVNTEWIYPPRGDRAAILQAADLDAPWPPEA